jgi:alkaline phosphatase D
LATLPRAERVKGKGHYVPSEDPQQAVLGEEQWAWLAGALREPAELRIVLSSIQVAATEHRFEHWGNFPRERARLFKALRDSAARGLIVVSGDRHAAEISRVPPGDDGIDYPLFDLTASSFNQSRGVRDDEPNRHRVGPRYGAINFGTIEIDWDAATPTVTLAIRDEQAAVVHAERVPFAVLAPPAGR